jgi:hypothetical protein
MGAKTADGVFQTSPCLVLRAGLEVSADTEKVGWASSKVTFILI